MTLTERINRILFPKWTSVEKREIKKKLKYEYTTYDVSTWFEILYSPVRNEYKLKSYGHDPSLYPSIILDMNKKIKMLRAENNKKEDKLIELY